MADKSAIEWTDATWNPTVGCSIVSPGCTNCYAMKTAHGLERRFASKKYTGLTKVVNGNPVWTGEVRLDEDALLQPLKWKKGRRIFVNSMSDMFHEALPDSAILRVLDIIRRTSWDGGSNCGSMKGEHTYQVLTKRAKRMAEFMPRLRFNQNAGLGECALYLSGDGKGPIVLKNLWLGVSAERQEEWDDRGEHLRNTPAAVTFVSCEPLLGWIRFSPCRHCNHPGNILDWPCPHCKGRRFEIPDWVIAGGESGPNARPMHPDWARRIRDDCAAAGVPYFFKQWGEHRPVNIMSDATERFVHERVGKKAAGRLLDGRTHDEFPTGAA